MVVRYVCSMIVFLSFLGLKTTGQNSPPPMAMPEQDNKAIIDKIIVTTNHEKYFIDFCTGKVKEHAASNNWPPEKTAEILSSIKFSYYNSTIYNSYAFYSTEQLNKLLDALVSINTNPKNNLSMILTNSMMQSNLDGFVKGVIEGRYVVRN